ncbi:MAG: hypothetical protein M1831_004270 [Alyxoria varia]|nr:MAG: hypothetical protein M1831_004270 [Alyxoria varia]
MSSFLETSQTFTFSAPLSQPEQPKPAEHIKKAALSLLHDHTRFIRHQPFVQSVEPQDRENDPGARELGISLRGEWLDLLERSPVLPPQLSRIAQILGKQPANDSEHNSNNIPPVKLYTVTEKLPYIGRITFTVALLDTSEGMASYAKAGLGTSVCGSFSVCSDDAATTTTPSDGISSEGGESGQGTQGDTAATTKTEQLVMKEYAILRGNKFLMPFIRGNAEAAQKGLLENLAQEVRGESAAS